MKQEIDNVLELEDAPEPDLYANEGNEDPREAPGYRDERQPGWWY